MIYVTCGEPGGIGPDICLRYAAQNDCSDLVFQCDPEAMTQRARILGLPVDLVQYRPESDSSLAKGQMLITPLSFPRQVNPGELQPANAQTLLDGLRQIVNLCLSGQADALVTGPLNKAVINEAGIAFSGHTEFLQQLTGVRQVVMLLASETMKVALVTTHIPLRAVASAISIPLIERVVSVLVEGLRKKYGIDSPRVLVAGLNPHAGEGGHLGSEEISVIEPALERLRLKGHNLIGPLPADTLFSREKLDQSDVVLAMYHDQGLPVLKFASFGRAANVTLGLPMIRTSVDHGTALEIAGSGKAREDSLGVAIDQARVMVKRQQVERSADDAS